VCAVNGLYSVEAIACFSTVDSEERHALARQVRAERQGAVAGERLIFKDREPAGSLGDSMQHHRRRPHRRSDALARRCELMDAWACDCDGSAGDNVSAFKRPA
jgi:hypothetical protein